MEISKLNSEKEITQDIVNWMYVPELDTIIQYLNTPELIELSLACKQYNNKITKKLLSHISLIGFPRILPKNKLILIFRRRQTLGNLLYNLRADYGLKLDWVTQVTFNDSNNSEFSRKFSKLFPNVKTLIFKNAPNTKCLVGLKDILYGLACLKRIEFWISEGDTFNYITSNEIFPRTLESILINVNHYSPAFFSNFDLLDRTYINLTQISIISNDMLTNLTHTLPNLVEVHILNYWDLDNEQLLKFLQLNQNLKKLITKFSHPSIEIINLILSLKKLEYWKIDKYSFMECDISNLPQNSNIKTLSLGRKLFGNAALQLINSCKALTTLEFVDCDLTNYDTSLKWHKLQARPMLIKLVNCQVSTLSIKTLDNLALCNRAEFTSSHCSLHIIRELNNIGLMNYVFIPSLTESIDGTKLTRFFLVKRIIN
jgi:hypothetical protein